ncbi:MAG TPA: retroviral-like aspartic protease family protein [Bryobacteraceae bacterium]|nr:retroviral-like aspartic protease family protein [Bryobacteraceae bacterium]
MLRICYRFAVCTSLLAGSLFGAHVASEYRDYTVRLSSWHPASSEAAGVLVPVRINDGRVLRLLLDSGASGITISSKTARGLGLEEFVSEGRIGGLGDGPVRTAQTAKAGRVTIGELALEDCAIAVVPGTLTRDADGVIGMNVFEAFRIRLDVRAKELRLEAFTDNTPKPGTHTYAVEHILLVRARVNGGDEGFFLVDTGSAVTSLASDFRLPAASSGGTVSLVGVAGNVSGVRRLAPVSLEIGGRTMVDREPVAMNLETISQRNGVKVSGILGYSVLSRAPVTFNYRDGLVELGSR